MTETSLEKAAETHPSEVDLAHSAEAGHGEVEHGGGHHAAPLTYNPDAPSEEWGWHGHWSDFAPRGRFLLLGLGVAGLLLMLIGNHQSHVEDYYLVLIAVILAGWMVMTQIRRKRERRRRP